MAKNLTQKQVETLVTFNALKEHTGYTPSAREGLNFQAHCTDFLQIFLPYYLFGRKSC